MVLHYEDITPELRTHIQNLWDGEYTTTSEYIARCYVIYELFAECRHDDFCIPVDLDVNTTVRGYIASYHNILDWIDERIRDRFGVRVNRVALVDVIFEMEINDERLAEGGRRMRRAMEGSRFEEEEERLRREAEEAEEDEEYDGATPW
ncbi:MAG: hypothetical protein MMC33_006607 [Icmadophila ericetorum]|nr:hypothetical protein [Icmadophila ericetorum]